MTVELDVLDIFSGVDDVKHEWGFVSFAFASWTECSCGYRPDSQEEYNQHSKENGIDIHEPIEKRRAALKPVTYDVNPIYDGVDSKAIVRHTSMVAAVRDMVSLIQGEIDKTEKTIRGWHIQYNDDKTVDPPYAEYVLPDEKKEDAV